MLLRAPVQALKSGQISTRTAHIAIVMRRYPRYTPKDMANEYVRALAPDETLFTEFKARERETGDHNQAFADVRYEERFEISDMASKELGRLSQLAKRRDVYLICQCSHDQRCHADLLLMAAEATLGAPIAALPFVYSEFARRLLQSHGQDGVIKT